MKSYVYDGKTFQIESSGECEAKVTDGKNTAIITKNDERESVYVVKLRVGGNGRVANKPDEAIDVACRQLIRLGTPSPDDPCKDLKDFIDSIEEGTGT